MIIIREVRDQPMREHGKILRRHQMIGVRPARGIDEVAVGEADLLGLLVHAVGKGFLAAGETFSHHDAGIIARLDDDASDEVLDRDLAVDVDEHLRALGRPRLLRNMERVGELEVAPLQRVEQHVDGHQLAHRRRLELLAAELVVENRAGLVVDHIGMRRHGVDRAGRSRTNLQTGCDKTGNQRAG